MIMDQMDSMEKFILIVIPLNLKYQKLKYIEMVL